MLLVMGKGCRVDWVDNRLGKETRRGKDIPGGLLDDFPNKSGAF